MNRKCPICRKKVDYIDFRSAHGLQYFITPWAKIKPSSDSGTCAKHQRRIKDAIKRARYLAIMPYLSR